jgi:DeoR family transcriptional regulator, aga operon transcriptional repressor
MAMHTQTERRNMIRRLLAQEGSLRVEELADRLSVTSMTVRRDLTAMEVEGVLVRTHGGCNLQSPMARDLSFSEKDALCARQKAAIAREAARRVEPGSSLFIDTGTTALHFARALPNTLSLRVFTNNLRVAMDLFGREGFEVIVYGGRLATQSPDLVGEIALGRVRDYRLNVAVLGADGIDPGRGEIYGADMHASSLDRLVLGQSERSMVLADSSKIGRVSLSLITRLRTGITLVTDSGALPRDLRLLEETEAEIVVAEVPEKGEEY